MQIKRHLQATLAGQAILLLTATNSGEIAYTATGGTPPPSKTHYRFTAIDIPDQLFMAPLGPNDEGAAVGLYVDTTGHYHGFVWRDGKVALVDAPGWAQTALFAINDSDVIAASVYNDNLTELHTAVYRPREGTWTLIPDVPGHPIANNVAINNKGVLMGSSSQGDVGFYNNTVGWTWDGESYSFFTVPGASGSGYGFGTSPLGINDRGQVTGYYTDDLGLWHGFLKNRSNITTFDVPGADLTEPFGINDDGDIAGIYYILSPTFQEQGFIYHAGHFVTVEVPGYGGPTGINNRGEIVGTYQDSSGVWHGFVGTPDHDGCKD